MKRVLFCLIVALGAMASLSCGSSTPTQSGTVPPNQNKLGENLNMAGGDSQDAPESAPGQ
jgi:hypothetical protein